MKQNTSAAYAVAILLLIGCGPASLIGGYFADDAPIISKVNLLDDVNVSMSYTLDTARMRGFLKNGPLCEQLTQIKGLSLAFFKQNFDPGIIIQAFNTNYCTYDFFPTRINGLKASYDLVFDTLNIVQLGTSTGFLKSLISQDMYNPESIYVIICTARVTLITSYNPQKKVYETSINCDIKIYAKTSTAQTSDFSKRKLDTKFLEHGWFVAYFPHIKGSR